MQFAYSAMYQSVSAPDKSIFHDPIIWVFICQLTIGQFVPNHHFAIWIFAKLPICVWLIYFTYVWLSLFVVDLIYFAILTTFI